LFLCFAYSRLKKERKLQICPISLVSVLFFLHNSKVAYFCRGYDVTLPRRYHDNFFSIHDNFLSVRHNFLSSQDNFLSILDNFLSTLDNFLSIHDNLLSAMTTMLSRHHKIVSIHYKILPTWQDFSL